MTHFVSAPFARAVLDKIHTPNDLTALIVIVTAVRAALFGELAHVAFPG